MKTIKKYDVGKGQWQLVIKHGDWYLVGKARIWMPKGEAIGDKEIHQKKEDAYLVTEELPGTLDYTFQVVEETPVQAVRRYREMLSPMSKWAEFGKVINELEKEES